MNIGFRDVVPSRTDAVSDARKAQPDVSDSKVDNLNAVPRAAPVFEARGAGQAAEGGFKGEVFFGGGEAVQFGKEQAPGGKTRRAGVEGRKARGKEVGVNEIPDVLLRQKSAGESGLSRALGPAMIRQRGIRVRAR